MTQLSVRRHGEAHKVLDHIIAVKVTSEQFAESFERERSCP